MEVPCVPLGCVTSLNRDDCGQRTATARCLIHLGNTLQEPGLQVDRLYRVRLTTRKAARQARHLNVGSILRRKVTLENDFMITVVVELLLEHCVNRHCSLFSLSITSSGQHPARDNVNERHGQHARVTGTPA